MTNGRNQLAVLIRASLIRQFGGKCEVADCTEVLGLEFAHVADTPVRQLHSGQHDHSGRGRKERQTDIRKNPRAYLLLCDNHHGVLTKLERKFGTFAGSREMALRALSMPLEQLQKLETWIL